MSKVKKQSKFRNFIDKAKDLVPGVVSASAKLASGNYLGAISDVGQLLTGKVESEPENEKVNALLYEYELKREEFAIEEYELQLKDKERATDLYKHDADVQKKLVYLFMFIYLFMTVLMLYGFYQVGVSKVELPNYLVAFVTSLYTGLSMKVNTIIDFFFGSSTKDKTQQHEKD
jgi:hypothetical protein